ncbi:hypothetical protein HK100_010911 [Physocladia obscura]|uniref:EF-hand domain-containing protein n=1 Tax=Physocladia obscura TaxID=109957 RepID=A0AAD5XEH7_9FUNG|nr:hypothetical protein HK100_010911 [Physocladia obscura]
MICHPRYFAVVVAGLVLAAGGLGQETGNYGDVHRDALAYKAQAKGAKGASFADDLALFFELHDTNRDGHLDGHELCESPPIRALLTNHPSSRARNPVLQTNCTAVVIYAAQDEDKTLTKPRVLADLTQLVDTVLDMDDTDNDGMISWQEYFASQQFHHQ